MVELPKVTKDIVAREEEELRSNGKMWGLRTDNILCYTRRVQPHSRSAFCQPSTAIVLLYVDSPLLQ